MQVKIFPVSTGVQSEKHSTGNTITSNGLVNLVLDGLHNCLRLYLCPLSFAHELDFVKCNKSPANLSHPAEVIEGILELSKLKFLLAVNDTSCANRSTFIGILKLGG